MAQPTDYELLGVRVEAASLSSGLARALALARAKDGRAHTIALPYVEFLTTATRQPELTDLLNGTDLCLPNGVGLVWAAHYLYGGRPSSGRLITTLPLIVLAPSRLARPLPARFDSANFTWPLLEAAAKTGLTVWLIGSPKAQSIDMTAVHLEQQIPELKIAGTSPGTDDAAAVTQLTERLRAARPDIILVGMGFPRQERLMHKLAPRLEGGVMIGEGGSFDYAQFGGRIKRAPNWLRRIGLEWLWRLIRQPSRLRRQLAIPRFIWLVYRQGRRQASQQ